MYTFIYCEKCLCGKSSSDYFKEKLKLHSMLWLQSVWWGSAVGLGGPVLSNTEKSGSSPSVWSCKQRFVEVRFLKTTEEEMLMSGWTVWQIVWCFGLIWLITFLLSSLRNSVMSDAVLSLYVGLKGLKKVKQLPLYVLLHCTECVLMQYLCVPVPCIQCWGWTQRALWLVLCSQWRRLSSAAANQIQISDRNLIAPRPAPPSVGTPKKT